LRHLLNVNKVRFRCRPKHISALETLSSRVTSTFNLSDSKINHTSAFSRIKMCTKFSDPKFERFWLVKWNLVAAGGRVQKFGSVQGLALLGWGRGWPVDTHISHKG